MRIGPAFLLLPALAGCSKLLPPKDQVIALEGATLIDGAGGPPKQDALIIIRNGHIESIARVNEIPVPNGAERIDFAALEPHHGAAAPSDRLDRLWLR